jgi:hypothetical protein
MRNRLKSTRHSAIFAIMGTFIALVVTLPFATAYFRAYEPLAIPAWMGALAKASPDLFEFAAQTRVYQLYGRLYSLVIPLTIPALLVLKNHIGIDTRISLWGWRVFLGGMLTMGAGIFGDYWPGQDSFWIGLGFMFEMIGMVVLGAGAALYGIAALKSKVVSRWIGFGLVGIAPLGVLGCCCSTTFPAAHCWGIYCFG